MYSFIKSIRIVLEVTGNVLLEPGALGVVFKGLAFLLLSFGF